MAIQKERHSSSTGETGSFLIIEPYEIYCGRSVLEALSHKIHDA